ncbi:MAG: zinc ribbon domain-containing protein [Gemmatimonadales bacterium]
MHPDLLALLALQEKDKAVMAVEQELQRLEPELAALDEALEEAEAAFAAARKEVEEADNRRVELEGKIEGYRVMQERRRQRLEWVKGAKEASTLMAELDLARSVLAREEAEWIRSSDRVQEAERRAAESERVLEELRAAQAPGREAIAAKQQELDDQLAAAMSERQEAAKSVDRTLLSRYERILAGRAPLALYPLRNGACSQCYTAMPLHRRQKLLNGEGVEPCEACGVLVYDPGEAQDA